MAFYQPDEAHWALLNDSAETLLAVRLPNQVECYARLMKSGDRFFVIFHDEDPQEVPNAEIGQELMGEWPDTATQGD